MGPLQGGLGCFKDVKYSIGYTVKVIVMTMYGVRWVLDLAGDHFVSYVNVLSLCCTSETNIILNANKKVKKTTQNPPLKWQKINKTKTPTKHPTIISQKTNGKLGQKSLFMTFRG